MGFDRIIGQDLLKSRMASEVVSRRGSTYIVSGPSGSGKTYISNELGKAFLCESPVQNGACGKCRCCLYSENGTNPDIIRVEPEKEGSNISVEKIRETVELCETHDPAGIIACVKGIIQKEDSSAWLASCTIPVLSVCGDSDALVTEEIRARMAADCPNVKQVILPKCGHNVFLECPEKTLELIREFV